jgi:hypothetical protein
VLLVLLQVLLLVLLMSMVLLLLSPLAECWC